MKIDAHQHFWKYDPLKLGWINDAMQVLKRDYLPPDLKREMDKTGFDGCVAVQASQSEEETDFLLAQAEQYNYIKGVVGWVDLCDYNVKNRLTHYAQFPKLCGMRHIVHDEEDDYFLLRPDFMRGVKMLKEFDLTYDILIFEKHLAVTLQYVSYFPESRLVVDHIAKPRIATAELSPWKENIRSLAEYPNVYCKLSGMVTEADWKNWKPDDFKIYLDVVFEAFGTNKLMIGSDWPVCRLAAEYEEVMAVVENYISQLSQDEQARILGGNAIDFYQLSI
ncbi:L-fuconolactonase [Catalinimonas alkaloidigena]|uniref:amidohydrolase family protein n=1 Tax=Catalinimonas alkaloidigena TaxID=1075417 RepID=UPI0024069885|nr:amidohydrolase family protein [Catalinimonas alkaloidigena]MDF9795600.1 L-fuconolactonase [Catalinimonas alkaloidigena]